MFMAPWKRLLWKAQMSYYNVGAENVVGNHVKYYVAAVNDIAKTKGNKNKHS